MHNTAHMFLDNLNKNFLKFILQNGPFEFFKRKSEKSFILLDLTKKNIKTFSADAENVKCIKFDESS